MSRYNYVTEVLQELGAELGIGPLKFDGTDRVSLVFDGILVTLAYSTEPVELVWIYVDLGEVPDDSLLVPQQMLQVAFECWSNNVMTIGLDDDGKNGVGYSSIPVAVLELPLLKDMIDKMLQAAALVREHLAKTAFAEVQSPSATIDSQTREPEEAAVSHAGWERA